MRRKITVILCDRCENQIEEPPAMTLRTKEPQPGKRQRALEICASCTTDFGKWLEGSAVPAVTRKAKRA